MASLDLRCELSGIAVLVGTAKTGKEPHELDRNKVTFI